MDTKSEGKRDEGKPPRAVAVDLMDNEPHKHRMLPVWFFIGVILCLYGVMILAEGIYELSHPVGTKLEGLHAAVWWGALMIVVGAVFVQKNRRPVG
jgi:hypothetical protein